MGPVQTDLCSERVLLTLTCCVRFKGNKVIGVGPTGLHVFCRLGESLRSCPGSTVGGLCSALTALYHGDIHPCVK